MRDREGEKERLGVGIGVGAFNEIYKLCEIDI